jgi:hypothetical protein
MTLKQQIEATIAAYQKACKPENLNYEYCMQNFIQQGICKYCNVNSYVDLYYYLFEEDFEYIDITPEDLFNNNYRSIYCRYLKNTKRPTILKLHKQRLKYLQNLLNEINQ